MKNIVIATVDFLRMIGLLILAPIWGFVLTYIIITDCINTK